MIRRLVRTPGFSAAAVLTLALGVGASTALFSVMRAVLLRPFPFAEQDRLAVLWERDLERNHPFVEISYPAYRAWLDRSSLFKDLAAMPATNIGATLTGHGDPAQIQFRPVTPNFFELAGAPAALGRALAPSDAHARVAVLSHGLWQRLFGGAPSALGSLLHLDGEAYEVVGVMPNHFRYPDGAEAWLPIEASLPASLFTRREIGWLVAIGRLEDGVSLAEARDQLQTVADDLGRTFPTEANRAVVARPIADEILGDTRLALLLLAGAVGLVLLIACANVTNLLLARAAGRQREMATRLALGATPGALARQVLAETLPIGAVGAAAGMALAWVTLELLAVSEAGGLPRGDEIAVDPLVVGFAAAVSLVAVLLSAGLPALRTARGALAGASGARAGDSRGVARMRDLLVAGEIALALVVAVGASLVGRTFLDLQRADFGFDPAGVLTAEIGLSPARSQTPASRHAALDEIRARLETEPAVEHAAFVFIRPLWGQVGFDWPFQAEEQTPAEAARNPGTNFEAVTPGYFKAMDIRLLEGRDFAAGDDERALGAVVVSAGLAERIWPGGSAVGRRIRGPGLGQFSNQWLTVVGVAEDARYREVEGTRFDVYMAHTQAPMPLRYMVVKTSLKRPEDLTPALRAAVRAVDPGAFVDDARSMQAIVDDALADRRLRARLFLTLAALAVALAIGGVYGVMSYSVAERRRELAVRVALGAGGRSLFRLVFGRGTIVTAAGIAAGLAASLALSGVARSLLAGLSPRDPMTFALAACLIGVAALAACYLPARRASRADPAEALRM